MNSSFLCLQLQTGFSAGMNWVPLSSHLSMLLPTPNPCDIVVISTDQGPHHVSALMCPVPAWGQCHSLSLECSLGPWQANILNILNILCLMHVCFAVCSRCSARSLNAPHLLKWANPSGMMVACVPLQTQALLCDTHRTIWDRMVTICLWDHTSSIHFFSLHGISYTWACCDTLI